MFGRTGWYCKIDADDIFGPFCSDGVWWRLRLPIDDEDTRQL